MRSRSANLAQRTAGMAPAFRSTPVLGDLLRRIRESADSASAAHGGPPPLSVVTPEGTLYGYLRHRAFLHQVAQEEYESYSLALLLEAVTDGTTVVDGGAHVGLYSLLASTKAGRLGRCFAFEADPYNFRALAATVHRNRLTNVQPLDRALGDVPGSATFFASPGTIGGSLVQKSYIGETRALRVPVTTIDLQLASYPVDRLVMKLDVEGAEERVLLGARETLGRCGTGRLLVEHNPEALRDGGSSGAAIVQLLESLDFRVAFVDEVDRRLHPVTVGNIPSGLKGNLLADKP
jgi:FkbM family methyltransferase